MIRSESKRSWVFISAICLLLGMSAGFAIPRQDGSVQVGLQSLRTAYRQLSQAGDDHTPQRDKALHLIRRSIAEVEALPATP